MPIEGVTERIDLLFYNLWMHCYVVVEVKVKPFESRYIGQTAIYVAIADDLKGVRAIIKRLVSSFARA